MDRLVDFPNLAHAQNLLEYYQMRIDADESGTHANEWLVIGMLFSPDHGKLHNQLCKAKDDLEFFNRGKRKAHYKETHFAEFKSKRDLNLAKAWIDIFLHSTSVFRCVVVDWSIYDPKYFGHAYHPPALKKRRAYKKWAEMLLQPEVAQIQNGVFYLDRLRALYGYDVVDHLEDRFCFGQDGRRRSNPRIQRFIPAQSWKDANQSLQLCDLLVGCVYQSLVPSKNKIKLATRSYLYEQLRDYGVKRSDPGFWRQYSRGVLTKHFPRFSQWFWKPTEKKGRRKKKKPR